MPRLELIKVSLHCVGHDTGLEADINPMGVFGLRLCSMQNKLRENVIDGAALSVRCTALEQNRV